MKATTITCITILLLMLFTGASLHAQLELRYVNSQQVLEEYPAWQEVERQLAETYQAYEKEYETLRKQFQKVIDELQNQSLLLSPEKKAEKENEAAMLNEQITRFQYEKFGQPQGEYFNRERELKQPLIDKINLVIQKVGSDRGYDYILDASVGGLLYGKEEFDITQEIIEELNKTQ